MQTEPAPLTIREFGALATALIAVTMFVYGIAWRIARPWIDESRHQSWIRKSTDVETHLRKTIFVDDIKERQRMHKLAVRALRTANRNAEAITHLIETQRTATQLLASIPHLAATMENMSSNLEKMAHEIGETNVLCRGYGEKIAVHEALIGRDGTMHMHKRATDVQPEASA